jgi:hypothetical protein
MADARSRLEQQRHESLAALHERAHQPLVGPSVGSQLGRRRCDRALQHDRRPVVQRMRERRIGLDDLEPVLRQGQLPEEG